MNVSGDNSSCVNKPQGLELACLPPSGRGQTTSRFHFSFLLSASERDNGALVWTALASPEEKGFILVHKGRASHTLACQLFLNAKLGSRTETVGEKERLSGLHSEVSIIDRNKYLPLSPLCKWEMLPGSLVSFSSGLKPSPHRVLFVGSIERQWERNTESWLCWNFSYSGSLKITHKQMSPQPPPPKLECRAQYPGVAFALTSVLKRRTH